MIKKPDKNNIRMEVITLPQFNIKNFGEKAKNVLITELEHFGYRKKITPHIVML